MDRRPVAVAVGERGVAPRLSSSFPRWRATCSPRASRALRAPVPKGEERCPRKRSRPSAPHRRKRSPAKRKTARSRASGDAGRRSPEARHVGRARAFRDAHRRARARAAPPANPGLPSAAARAKPRRRESPRRKKARAPSKGTPAAGSMVADCRSARARADFRAARARRPATCARNWSGTGAERKKERAGNREKSRGRAEEKAASVEGHWRPSV